MTLPSWHYVTLHADGSYSLTVRNEPRVARDTLAEVLGVAALVFGPRETIAVWDEQRGEFASELQTCLHV